ncbi:hypothetical protein GA0115233_103021 [Streptomyces sp. DI166]|uniref:hypothetical protein n=1 Tax=Streptomyces sp. DI166 TaxID=1839783 RepID=UPI0007F43162|nr:hypothetical protein [Streptomyces sp. DI166]SBT91389.1 hypothetical protein GA0115233_103021 [Streptomyces sp. DI166]
MSGQWKRVDPKPWERAMAARAAGRAPEPEDLEEARRRARPGDTPGWAELVAAKVMGESGRKVVPQPAEPPAEPESRMVRELRRRFGTPEAPPPAA